MGDNVKKLCLMYTVNVMFMILLLLIISLLLLLLFIYRYSMLLNALQDYTQLVKGSGSVGSSLKGAGTGRAKQIQFAHGSARGGLEQRVNGPGPA